MPVIAMPVIAAALVLGTALETAPLRAQVEPARGPAGTLIVCDSADDRLLRFHDRDGSGLIEGKALDEVALYYDGAASGILVASPSHIAADGDGRVFLVNGGSRDAVVRLQDTDGDGDANDAGEAMLFFDSSGAGPALASPNTLLVLPDGSLLLSDDGSRARWILRLADLDGDGDAQDDGEAAVFYMAATEDESAITDPESLALSSEGVLFVGDTTKQSVFRLQDANGDGDAMDPGESALYFAGTEELPLTDIDALAAPPGGTVFAANEDSGLIVALRDLDGDGSALSPGEALAFVDSSAAERVRDVNDLIAVEGVGLLVIDGAADTVFIVNDANGDGDALDEGEVVRWIQDRGENLSTPIGLAYVAGAPPSNGHEFLRGDANLDASLDLSDAVRSLEFLFLGAAEPACLDPMDVDDSGDLTISDPIYSLNFLFGGGPAPPPPFPAPGADPTNDGLACGSV